MMSSFCQLKRYRHVNYMSYAMQKVSMRTFFIFSTVISDRDVHFNNTISMQAGKQTETSNLKALFHHVPCYIKHHFGMQIKIKIKKTNKQNYITIWKPFRTQASGRQVVKNCLSSSIYWAWSHGGLSVNTGVAQI